MGELRAVVIKLGRMTGRIRARDGRTGCDGSSGPSIGARGYVVAPEVTILISRKGALASRVRRRWSECWRAPGSSTGALNSIASLVTVCGGARPGPRGELSSPKSMSASSSSGFPPGEIPSPISNWSRPLVSVGERGDVAIVSRVAPYDVRRAMVVKCQAHGTPCSGASVGGSGVIDTSFRRSRAAAVGLLFSNWSTEFHTPRSRGVLASGVKVVNWASQSGA